MKAIFRAHPCSILIFLPVMLLSVAMPSRAFEGDHTYSSEATSLGYRTYVQNCALCHGLEGSWIEGIDLSRGQFRTVVSDHDLRGVISTGAAEGRMPRFDLSDNELDGLIAYIRIGFDPDGAAIQIGDANQGKVMYHGEAACVSCHRINGHGPRSAPDLSDIGLQRTPAALQRTLVDPQASLLPINRPVSLITANDYAVTGRRLNEDTYTVQLIDATGQLRSFDKSTLKHYEVSETAVHKPTQLSGEEVADLVAFLLSLRGEL